MTVVEHMGIEYMIGTIGLEEAERHIENQLRAILAGKYENL